MEMSDIAAWVLENVREKFKRLGTLGPPAAMLFGAHVPEAEGKAIVLVSTGKDKPLFVANVRELVRLSNASGCAFVSEAWAARPGSLDEAERDDFEKEWAGKLKNHPASMECLFISLEHKAGESVAFMAEIVRDHIGRPTLTPWQDVGPVDQEDSVYSGFFEKKRGVTS